MTAKNNIQAYILAGGKSSRMGSDKGLLNLHGKHLVDYVVAALAPEISQITLVTNNAAYSRFGLPLLADSVENAGPAGGIYTALRNSKSPLNFICSCDMPFITAAGVKFMIEKSQGADICVPQYLNNPEPLFGLYASDCANEWERLLQQGTYKLQHFFLAFSTRLVNVDENPLFASSFFSNINSPADLLAAETHTWK